MGQGDNRSALKRNTAIPFNNDKNPIFLSEDSFLEILTMVTIGGGCGEVVCDDDSQ